MIITLIALNYNLDIKWATDKKKRKKKYSATFKETLYDIFNKKQVNDSCGKPISGEHSQKPNQVILLMLINFTFLPYVAITHLNWLFPLR